MLTVNNISVRFSSKELFKDVNLKFTIGNCYGVIGANGAGKSTFLKILSKEIEPDTGSVILDKNMTMFTLKQDHFAYEENTVLETVIAGNEKLLEISKEKELLYSKEDFTENDGIRAGELEDLFAQMDGWEAESNAAILLNGLGINEELQNSLMKELSGSDKVKVLLAQALFSNSEILLLDEPTNNLDVQAIAWLEDFLMNYEKTTIVVSHDRHFLNKICTHICDVDYGQIKIYSGNYDFWYQSSELLSKQLKDKNKKNEEKIKELEDFIKRFSANASKSKQATSRKKILDKIVLDDLKPSTRKYPFIDFKFEKESGKVISTLKVNNCKIENEDILNNIEITILKGDKIALLGDPIKCSTLLKCFNKEIDFDGDIEFGQTINYGYIPNDNSKFFESDKDIITWLTQYSKVDDPTFIRGFLGRMLFSGEDAFKKVKVLSGGEKVRCMLSKTMLEGPNLLFLDDPTNHLDLESITALNDGLINYKGELVFLSHDHQFIQTIANRIIVIENDKIQDYRLTYDEYLEKQYSIKD